MRWILGLALLFAALPGRAADEKAKPNTLTPKEIADGRLLLFDGEGTFGWKTEGNVEVKDGVIHLGGKGPASITTTAEFGFCDLRFEFVGKGGVLNLQHREHAMRPVDAPPAWTAGHFRMIPREDQYLLEWKFSGGKSEITNTKPTAEDRPVRAPVRFSVPAGVQLQLRSIKLRPMNLQTLFNGKDLTGWKTFPGDRYKSKFEVTKEGWLNVKNGPGDLQSEGQWADFVLQLDCISNGKFLNSGIFFRCLPGQYQNGYEAQIQNGYLGSDRTKPIDFGTGAIYRRQPARKVISNDKEWFTMTVVANGKHIATWVNGYPVVDWTDNRPADENARKGAKTGKGHISIQGHDPTTDLSFRNIRIAELPAAGKK